MIISANDKQITLKTVFGDTMRRGGKSYPALRFEFESGVSAEEVEALLSGKFDILNEAGEIIGTHEGYNTLKSISVVVGKITTADQQIEELESSLATIQAEKDELQNAIDVIVGGNAE